MLLMSGMIMGWRKVMDTRTRLPGPPASSMK
jgi:hypothetical protein